MKNVLKLSLLLALGSVQYQAQANGLITLNPGDNYEIGTLKKNGGVRYTDGQVLGYAVGKKDKGVMARVTTKTVSKGSGMGSMNETMYTLHVSKLSKPGKLMINKNVFYENGRKKEEFKEVNVIKK